LPSHHARSGALRSKLRTSGRAFAEPAAAL
jgi:hypothetical protein